MFFTKYVVNCLKLRNDSMTETEIIEGLLSKDERITRHFFFSDKEKSCKLLLMNILNYVFPYPVEYEEAVSEFYAYLLENDGYRLRQIRDRSSLFGWIKVSATRFFIKKRDNLAEKRSQDALLDKVAEEKLADGPTRDTARKDMLRILHRMKNKRYAYVLQQLILNDMEPEKLANEMKITAAALYNIKRRAIAEFTQVAQKDVKYYEK